ncbi:Hsp20/alpha crystallin family protein [Clostridium sp. BJN0001]|uniref:Hsp20/alpha crystallin family protein n=1 Tax=Clostridium sp. BJN0001 TaxID=2930219 RepID=UPI001FD552A6|nr:Hsp20/alpha crystallin family protein [Clostridium sp. BJN0001]
MFGLFPFGSGLNGLSDLFSSVIGSVDINIFISGYSNYPYNEDTFHDEYKESIPRISYDDTFIDLQKHRDMYILTIDLTGIDLREVSIKYDPGIITINLNKIEQENDDYYYPKYIKRRYSKDFNNIEDIDTSKLVKSIDNGVLKILMPKKYAAIESSNNVVDVDYIEGNK